MKEENKMIPEGTLLAYSKVSLEYQALSLEVFKLGRFLDDPKHVSEEMLAQMRKQYSTMIVYKEQLGLRLMTFERVNLGIQENSKGSEIIGQFNNTNNPQLEEIKIRSAQLVNCIDAFGKDQRRKATAITNIEQGTMWAVKSLF